jgi:hypothetical protein
MEAERKLPRGGNHRGAWHSEKGTRNARQAYHAPDLPLRRAFLVYPSLLNAGGGRFCSHACAVAGGRRRTGDPANTLTRTCEWCGQVFSVPRSTLTHDPARYCGKPCYFAAWRAGAPERFWAKVDMNGPVVRPELGPCWLWTGVIVSGYGRVTDPGRGQTGAHQMAWRLAGGSLLTRKHVLHVCDVRTCVRNDGEGVYELNGVQHPRYGHLFLGTHADNMQDLKAKGTSALRPPADRRRRPPYSLAEASEYEQARPGDASSGSAPPMIRSIVRTAVVSSRHLAQQKQAKHIRR